MALPTITLNTSTGSDSLASGSGGTAITGSSATTSGASTTIALDGSPDLSGVATDGSACIRITNHGFYSITAKDNTAKTVTVTTAINIVTGRAWAIGGTLATLDATESRRLWAATAAGVGSDTGSGGVTTGWIIVLEDDQTVTSAIPLAFTAGSGALKVTASSLRQLTQSGNAAMFSCNTANRIIFERIQFRHSNATKSTIFSATAQINIRLDHCIVGAADGTNCPLHCYLWVSGSGPILTLWRSAVLRTTSHGFTPFALSISLYSSEISRCGGAGINVTSGAIVILEDSIISHNTSYGITNAGPNTRISRSVVHGNGNTGYRSNSGAPTPFVTASQFTANTNYGIDISTASWIQDLTGWIEGCNFGNASDSTNNSVGAANFTASNSLNSSNLTVAPGYADPSNSVRNFAVGTAMKALGFPSNVAETIGGGTSGTSTYIDIGPQRQEASGGRSFAYVG